MIRIMGTYQGRTEEIDTADTAAEARYLVAQYQLAFGPAWVILTKRGW
jgi:hypothetical protein